MTTYNTEYGPIYYDNTGNDHRPNMVDSPEVWVRKHGKHPYFAHEGVKLQKPALLAFQEAERRYAHKTRPFRKSRAILVTGSWRSFAYQYTLWRSDSKRYANPYTGGHVQGVAIDVNNELSDFNLIQDILLNVGWVQSRSDERWHFTWGPRV